MQYFKKKATGRRPKQPGEMNNTEKEYAVQLEALLQAGEILWYAYEAIKLRLAERTWLTIDFFVMQKDGALEAHEVKGGFWEDDARVKMKVAAEKYPFRIIAAQKLAEKHGGGWKVEEF